MIIIALARWVIRPWWGLGFVHLLYEDEFGQHVASEDAEATRTAMREFMRGSHPQAEVSVRLEP